MDLNEMGQWPCTPGAERLIQADKLINDDPQGVDKPPWERYAAPENLRAPRHVYDDAGMLLKITGILLFSNSAHEEMALLENAGQINTGTDLAEIAAEGSSENFIGTLIQLDGPDDEGSEFFITSLYRNNEWTGLNPQLPFCKGLSVHILHRENSPHKPEVIIAIPPTAEFAQAPGQEPQDPLSLAIQQVVT